MCKVLFAKGSTSPRRKAGMVAARAAMVAATGRRYGLSWVTDASGALVRDPADIAQAKRYAQLAARLYNAARAMGPAKALVSLYDVDGGWYGSWWAMGPYHAAALADETASHLGDSDGVLVLGDPDNGPDARDAVAVYTQSTGRWTVTG